MFALAITQHKRGCLGLSHKARQRVMTLSEVGLTARGKVGRAEILTNRRRAQRVLLPSVLRASL